MKVTTCKVTSHKISPDWDVKWPDGDGTKEWSKEGWEGF